jgi:hypothetical protein
MVTRGASKEVRPLLTGRVGVYPANLQDVNSAGLTLEDLDALPDIPIDPALHAALTFDERVPAGGMPGTALTIIYNRYDIVGWTYDAARGAYLRSQDQADESGLLVPATDRLTGEQLAFNNIVVLFARHRFLNPIGTILEIDLQEQSNASGILFRDGLHYPISWSTPGGRLELRDAAGWVIALRPGTTFYEVVSLTSTWDEAASVVRYHAPPVPTRLPTATPTKSRTPTPTLTSVPADTPEPTSKPPTDPPPTEPPEPSPEPPPEPSAEASGG